MTPPLDPASILRALAAGSIEYVLVGGLAVNAHGVIRSTRDVDICPSPDARNLQRLARLLKDLGARQLGVADNGLTAAEMPRDPTNASDLSAGGNFRLETDLGGIDLMQWLPGIEAEQAYGRLARSSLVAHAFGVEVKVCSLEDLLRMKEAAARPQDVQDVADLRAAHPELE